jgi:cytochrome c biogenesis protein CcmG, thiol:disulfide interchange protein DsbE
VSPQSKRSWVAVLIVVALVAVAFGINRATSNDKSDAAGAGPSRQELIAKANLPDCPTTTGSGAVDNGLPNVTLPCLGNGPKVDLAKLRGPTVVNIWAGTCPPCRAEAPLLREFASKAAGRVSVLGVVDGEYPAETWDDALDASRGLALRYPSVFDEKGKLVTWVRSAGIPVSLFISADGQVAYANIGQLKDGDLERLAKTYLDVEIAA